MEHPCDIVLLAAGSSSRLGGPKQLLMYKEHTLLQHSIQIALASLANRVIVVLGANAGIIATGIAKEDDRLTCITNDQWQEGLASSIRCGLQYLLSQKPAPQNVLFMVCDQPYINTVLLNKLITLQRQTGHSIVASKYAKTAGIPAIFSRDLFPELLQLTGDKGARKLIEQQKEAVTTVAFPLGTIDIDTMEDYESLQKKASRNDY